MFLLYWELHVLIELVLNLGNEELHWFNEERTFIDGCVYMGFSGGVLSTVAFSVIV